MGELADKAMARIKGMSTPTVTQEELRKLADVVVRVHNQDKDDGIPWDGEWEERYILARRILSAGEKEEKT